MTKDVVGGRLWPFSPIVADEGSLEYFFSFFRGAVLIRCAGYGGGFCFNSWGIRGGGGCCCGGDVDAWGGGCGGIGHGGFFGFRACAVWGCFIKGSLSVGGMCFGECGNGA